MIRINTGNFEVNENDPKEAPSRTGGVMLIFWALSPAMLLIVFGIITGGDFMSSNLRLVGFSATLIAGAVSLYFWCMRLLNQYGGSHWENAAAAIPLTFVIAFVNLLLAFGGCSLILS